MTPSTDGPHQNTGATKRVLLRSLLARPQTAEDLSRSLRIDRTVARRHLNDLRGAGLVEDSLQRGGRGRPRVQYSITAEGREVFYAKYDVVLDSLTRGALHRYGPRLGRALYQEAARTLAADLGFPSSTAETMHALREVGFEPELRPERGRRLMVSHNCPVLRQARRAPKLLCEAFHEGLLDRGFRGVHAELVQTLATGAPECIHLLVAARA